MAITTLKTQRLTDAGLDALFSKAEKHWLTHAKRSFNYMAQLVANQEDIYPDDLISTLVVALELEYETDRFPGQRKNSGRNIAFTYFAEYIVDELWDEI